MAEFFIFLLCLGGLGLALTLSAILLAAGVRKASGGKPFPAPPSLLKPTVRAPEPKSPGVAAVHRAFYTPFTDGTYSLCSALPDDLLLEHYRHSLGKLEQNDGDLEALSKDLSEMLIIHMEIASRFAALTAKGSKQ